MEKVKLCVAVPMFNEEGGASRCVKEITKVLSSMSEVSAKLLVVEDGSHDNTKNVLKSLQ